MKLALRELRRRPGRFALAVVILTFIAMLLTFLGGLLDGLYLGSTGAIRAQRADVIVYSKPARDSFLRSRITPQLRASVSAAPGVDAVGGLGVALVAAKVPGKTKLADAAVLGYELAPEGVPEPPPAGEAWADRRLRAFGVRTGMTLALGPAGVPVTVRGFVDDTSYLLQGSLWVAPATWRTVQNASRPDARIADDVFQVLVVRGDGGSALAKAIDSATGGATKTLTKAAAVLSLPGTKEQKSTFDQIITMTLAVALVVVALFFSLLTIERTGLYGVLKAIGASSRQLFGGVVVQALAVTVLASAIGSIVCLAIVAALPPGAIPLQLKPSRVVFVLVSMMIAAVVGSAMSLRRVTRIDPAAAIGVGS